MLKKVQNLTGHCWKVFWITKNTFIPPLFHENRFITDFKEKVKCQPVYRYIPTFFYLQSVSHLKMLVELFKIWIQTKLTVMITSVYACQKYVVRLLQTVRNNFRKTLSTGLFPSKWKKGNMVPTHNKGDKQVLKSYCLRFIAVNLWQTFWRTNFQWNV